MPRLQPPPGTVSRKVAVNALIKEHVITSAAMLNKLKGIERVLLEGRTHGFYREDQLLNLINKRRENYNKPPLKSLFDEQHNLVFRQATPEDMPGVYKVALKLFGSHTTSAEGRIPLIEKLPEGNVVVLDNDNIVSFAHIQPLERETLEKFITGEIRGNKITADNLDPFESGKVVDVIIKSMGSYHEYNTTARLYSKKLIRGLAEEIVEWGKKGYIIHRVYATSETQSGITLALDIPMIPLGRIPGTNGKKRLAFEVDPLVSKDRIFVHYRLALNKWRELHPEEYTQAWEKWNHNK